MFQPRIALCAFALPLLLVGCNESTSTENTSSKKILVQTTDQFQDGGFVFIDTNKNLLHDEYEPFTLLKENGKTTISLPTSLANNKELMIVVQATNDVDSNVKSLSQNVPDNIILVNLYDGESTIDISYISTFIFIYHHLSSDEGEDFTQSLEYISKILSVDIEQLKNTYSENTIDSIKSLDLSLMNSKIFSENYFNYLMTADINSFNRVIDIISFEYEDSFENVNKYANATPINDADGDYVPDIMDHLPNNSDDWIDSDYDGCGDNTDIWPSDDGKCFDTDADGIADSDDKDDDNDGVLDTDDKFPKDERYSLDTDNDGIANSIDPDDDNDGVSDSADKFPLDDRYSLDTDNDGIANAIDDDDDNDGITDSEDKFPLDDRYSLDTDNDGLANKIDPDDDNDGVVDSEDKFPLDERYHLDTDNDGIPNEIDTDTDNDGIEDILDAFPDDANYYLDTDNDGIANSLDDDDDNDRVLDVNDHFPYHSFAYTTGGVIGYTARNEIENNTPFSISGISGDIAESSIQLGFHDVGEGTVKNERHFLDGSWRASGNEKMNNFVLLDNIWVSYDRISTLKLEGDFLYSYPIGIDKPVKFHMAPLPYRSHTNNHDALPYHGALPADIDENYDNGQPYWDHIGFNLLANQDITILEDTGVAPFKEEISYNKLSDFIVTADYSRSPKAKRLIKLDSNLFLQVYSSGIVNFFDDKLTFLISSPWSYKTISGSNSIVIQTPDALVLNRKWSAAKEYMITEIDNTLGLARTLSNESLNFSPTTDYYALLSNPYSNNFHYFDSNGYFHYALSLNEDHPHTFKFKEQYLINSKFRYSFSNDNGTTGHDYVFHDNNMGLITWWSSSYSSDETITWDINEDNLLRINDSLVTFNSKQGGKLIMTTKDIGSKTYITDYYDCGYSLFEPVGFDITYAGYPHCFNEPLNFVEHDILRNLTTVLFNGRNDTYHFNNDNTGLHNELSFKWNIEVDSNNFTYIKVTYVDSDLIEDLWFIPTIDNKVAIYVSSKDNHSSYRLYTSY